MSRVVDNQCPCCGAPLFFNPTLQKFKCDYCSNIFTIDDLKKIQDTTLKKSLKEDASDECYYEYHCNNCGAEIVADENTSATFCLYCGNTAILKNRLSGEFKPSKIIPFTKTKEDAIVAFKNLAKGRPFMPKSFVSQKNIEKITGLYVPFWLFDINAGGTVTATATKVSSWRSGDRHYTKTDYYDLIRKGTMNFQKIPVDGSSRFDDNLMNSLEPYYLYWLVDYNYAYLSGFLAEKYDVGEDDAYPAAEARAKVTAAETLVNDMGNYSSKVVRQKNITTNKKNGEYVLLPVWMVNVKYNNKYYTFAMNGQTGEIVGDIPLNKNKVVIWSVGLFFIIFAIGILIQFVGYFIGG